MVSFIDEHRGEHGVEPICKQLPIAPSTCYAHKSPEREPDRACDQGKRDKWVQYLCERRRHGACQLRHVCELDRRRGRLRNGRTRMPLDAGCGF
jgi:hypothetical protein